MNVNEIGRTDERALAEVGPAREERVECAQLRVSWTRVAADDVGPQPNPRRPRDVLYRVPGVGCERPRLDPPAVKSAPLVHALEVVVQAAGLSKKARTGRMAVLIPRALNKCRPGA